MSVLNDTDNVANSSAPQPALNTSSPGAHRAEILENPLRTYLLGIIISICGNILISISLNIQKYAHVRQSQRDSKPYYTSAVWWCGVALMGIGELGNFAAYGFAPASLIAPLGSVSVIASAVISVIFLKETVRVSDVVGGSLAITGTYVLVTFAPHTITHITAHLIQYYIVSWYFVLYLSLEVLLFCILLYVYKKRNVKHIVVVMLLVALLASLTVISVKAVSGMITETIKGQLQFIYPIFYVMLVIMIASCAFQIKFLNQAMKMFDATEVVPINFVFFTASAIVAGIVFYQEFEGLALLNIFMFLFGCLLSFLGVFLIARNRPKIKQQDPDFIALDKIPSRSHTDKVQPEANTQTYGSLAAKLMCNSASRTRHNS
ncbi:NIPA-like protein 2 isoform X1 [Gasterosteus aculeatus]|uniref:NIPA like domain containing 2 n=1 Tax=Gasterosteus aculeatus aculeatus TaxID=481459 RepID=G3NGZ6_GASAC|nr:NIPA-like protein 2 isoform X1 [Gasterosteus aculeatus aculeatus]